MVTVLRAVSLYALAAWIYIAANSISHPWTLPRQLTHLASWPHENTFGLACFVLSFVAATAVEYLRPSARASWWGARGTDAEPR